MKITVGSVDFKDGTDSAVFEAAGQYCDYVKVGSIASDIQLIGSPGESGYGSKFFGQRKQHVEASVIISAASDTAVSDAWNGLVANWIKPFIVTVGGLTGTAVLDAGATTINEQIRPCKANTLAYVHATVAFDVINSSSPA